MCKLGLELLNGGWDFVLARRRVDANLGQLLDNTNVEIELGGGSARTTLLALLTLLAASASKVALLLGLLLGYAGTLQTGVVNGALGGSGELAGRGGFLGWERGGVEMADQSLSGDDLVTIGGCAGLFETLAGSRLALARHVLELLNALLFKANLAGLGLIVLVCAQLLEVCILEFFPCVVLLLLLGARLVRLLAQCPQVLEGFVLLSLQFVKLRLELGVLVAQRLVLRIVQQLLLFGNLGLDVVNLLLLDVETGEVLAGLVERADLSQGLLLVHQLHHAAVDLLLQARNLLVDILDGLVVRLALCRLELAELLLELLIELLDLLKDGVAAGLVALLRLANRVEFCLKLLLALAVGRVLVVRFGEV